MNKAKRVAWNKQRRRKKKFEEKTAVSKEGGSKS
jgi:hypothetical protein